MKKRLLIFSAAIITLSVFALSNSENDTSKTETIEVLENKNLAFYSPAKELTEFDFTVGTRFNPITPSNLNKATSISDFISEESYNSIIHLKSVKVVIIENERQTNKQEIGYTKTLNSKQLALLKANNYGLQFNIRSEFTAINPETSLVEDKFDSPHYSVEPKKQAIYTLGEKALTNYFIANTKAERVNVNTNKLQQAMFTFTVTKNGEIKNPNFKRTSKNKDMDNKMIELIQNLPGNWQPAENDKGQKVDQELVVRYGIKGMGC